MKLNFKNRVRNFKFSVGDIFVPFFEAIMNSMQSIEETNELQDKYNIPYPVILKENIISNNMKLLSGMLPSFDKQINKAFKRKDLVSVNHRVTEFLASYFDVIFALNEMKHPGEKRMQEICSKECKILPKNFDNNLNLLFENMFKDDVSNIINNIILELKNVVK